MGAPHGRAALLFAQRDQSRRPAVPSAGRQQIRQQRDPDPDGADWAKRHFFWAGATLKRRFCPKQLRTVEFLEKPERNSSQTMFPVTALSVTALPVTAHSLTSSCNFRKKSCSENMDNYKQERTNKAVKPAPPAPALPEEEVHHDWNSLYQYYRYR